MIYILGRNIDPWNGDYVGQNVVRSFNVITEYTIHAIVSSFKADTISATHGNQCLDRPSVKAIISRVND